MKALGVLLSAAALAVALTGTGGARAVPTPRPDPASPRPASPAPMPSGLPAPAASATGGGAAPGASPAAASPLGGASAGLGMLGALGSLGAPQAYAAFVKKAMRQHGLVDLLTKDDDVYLDLGREQLDHPYILAPVLASGVGSDAFAGRVFDPIVVSFQRVGKRILWVQKNAGFGATADAAAANALAISVTDSVINSSPIVAEDEATGRAVISTSFFLGDFENVGKDLGDGSAPGGGLSLFGLVSKPSYSVDASRSYVERAKALPANDEILASLAFSGPPGSVSGAPDGRGVRLRMHYSLVEPPAASGYVPRLADDRVGYFYTAIKRFGDDSLDSPAVRYIDRWNFAGGPITYYLTNEIPERYKPAIREALLQWNTAFARIGIPNAVEVKDAPADPAFDPDDARYSTVRWITSDVSPFAAYGPHIADPRTGQIMRVEIVLDGEALRTVKRGYADVVVPDHPAAAADAALGIDASGLPRARQAGTGCDPGVCDAFASDSAELAADGTAALRLEGASPERTERYAREWLESVVLHESGHNFGLRHNFEGSALYTLAQLHDARFTAAHGLVSSVMEYTPVNLSPHGEPQGAYFQSRLGPYDDWAIRYGYERFPNVRRPEDEIVPLRGLADESSQPRYRYGTDEDAGPDGIDPLVAPFDLGRDPLAFDANQFAVYDGLLARLDGVYPRDDRPYDQERRTFVTMLRGYARAAMLATRYVGGVSTSRDHRGQPGGAQPVVPVPRERSRAAFALLARSVFSSRAFRFSPSLVRDLGPNRFGSRSGVDAPSFPLGEYVGTVQDAVLFALLSPDVMARLGDAELAAPRERAMTLADLFGWTQAAVWDDVDAPSIAPLHRALQRRYTNYLVALSLASSATVNAIGFPGDAVPLARFELRRLDARVTRALRSPRADVETRAHLEDVHSRVAHALDPTATRGA